MENSSNRDKTYFMHIIKFVISSIKVYDIRLREWFSTHQKTGWNFVNLISMFTNLYASRYFFIAKGFWLLKKHYKMPQLLDFSCIYNKKWLHLFDISIFLTSWLIKHIPVQTQFFTSKRWCFKFIWLKMKFLKNIGVYSLPDAGRCSKFIKKIWIKIKLSLRSMHHHFTIFPLNY